MTAVTSDIDPVFCSFSYQEYKKVKCLHTWVIRDFSLIGDAQDSYVDSGEFLNGGNSSRQWSMRLYPAWLSLTVEVMLLAAGEVKATCRVWVVNKDDLKVKEQATAVRSFSAKSSWTAALGNRSEFLDVSKRLLRNDVLTLCCELTIFEPRKLSAACIVENPPGEPSFMDNFGRLFKYIGRATVTLTAGGKEIGVHMSVLAMRSPVLHAKLKHSMREKRESRVNMNNISADVLQEMVTFMYTDTAPNIDSLAVDLLQPAGRYGLKRLKSMCEYNLASKLSVDTAVEVLRLAVNSNAVQLRDCAVCYIQAHVDDVGKTDGWKAMVEEQTRLLKLFSAVGSKT